MISSSVYVRSLIASAVMCQAFLVRDARSFANCQAGRNCRSLVPDCINEKPGSDDQSSGVSRLNDRAEQRDRHRAGPAAFGFLDLNGELGRRFGSIGSCHQRFAHAHWRLATRRTSPSAGQTPSERAAISSACRHCSRLTAAHCVEIAEAIRRSCGSRFRHPARARALRQHCAGCTGCRSTCAATRFGSAAARRSGIGIGLFNSGGARRRRRIAAHPIARSADRQPNTVSGRLAHRARSRSGTYRRPRRRGERGLRALAALCRR